MPYGNYSAEEKLDFLDELILKDALFLLGDRYWPSRSAEKPLRDKPPVKAIVIACNTATSYGLEDIEQALETWGVPIYLVGVVAAGADGVAEALAPLPEPGAVAVMATVGTCASGGYVREIDRAAAEAGITPPVVIQQGSLGLAGAIEGSPEFISAAADATADYRGPAVDNQAAPIDESLIDEYGFAPAGMLGDSDDPTTWRLNSVGNYIQYDTTSLIEAHRRSGSTEPITAVVLGCTHFPYYTGAIEQSFQRLREFRTADGEAPYEHLIANDLHFVDPAVLTSVQLYEALTERGLLNEKNDASPADEFFMSVPNDAYPDVELGPDGRSFTYDFKYGRSPGKLDEEYVKRVPMSRVNLTTETLENIRVSMPAVWERMVAFGETSTRLVGVPDEDRIRESVGSMK
jgi:glutamate racemase